MLSSQGCPRLVQSFVFPRTKVTKRHWIGRVTWMSLIYLWATSSEKIINGNMALCTSSFCTPFLIKLKNAIGFGSLKTKHFRFNPGSLRKYAKSVNALQSFPNQRSVAIWGFPCSWSLCSEDLQRI